MVARNVPPTEVALLVAVLATFAAWRLQDGLPVRAILAAGLTLGPVMFVYAARGHTGGLSGHGDWQIDYHMFFFSAFAMLAAYVDWRPIAIAAALTAGHHLVLDLIVPANVFPEEGLDRVILHALAVLVECSMLVWFTVKVAALFERVEGAKKLELAELERQSQIDVLTGLPNRRALSEQLPSAIAAARRANSMMGVLFVDLDRFKNLNDTLGHNAGDVLLTELAKRLQGTFRAGDVVARMGGDEFVVILKDLVGTNEAIASASNFERVLSSPIRVGERVVEVTCSIGIAIFLQDGVDAETLVMNADTAMYQAKREGRASYRFFSPELHEAAKERLRNDLELRAAIADQKFVVHYQPIYSRAGRIVASEALVRWPQADGTVLQPANFLASAEETGLIIPLGSWVLREACRANVRWNRAGSRLRVCVNVSPKQLSDPGFVEVVRSSLEESGLEAALLELELTETMAHDDLHRCNAIVLQLKALGVRIALDDFGTGYNCLTTLRHLQPDTLKLDRSFVTDIACNSVDQGIAAVVLTSASFLGATVVAEGVETLEQVKLLVSLGCHELQGYWYGVPVCAADLESLLEAEAIDKSSVLARLAA